MQSCSCWDISLKKTQMSSSCGSQRKRQEVTHVSGIQPLGSMNECNTFHDDVCLRYFSLDQRFPGASQPAWLKTLQHSRLNISLCVHTLPTQQTKANKVQMQVSKSLLLVLTFSPWHDCFAKVVMDFYCIATISGLKGFVVCWVFTLLI